MSSGVGSGKAKGGALEMCKALLEEFRVESSMYQMGRTRIFFRAGVLGHLEDTWARIQRCCTGSCTHAPADMHTCTCRHAHMHRQTCTHALTDMQTCIRRRTHAPAGLQSDMHLQTCTPAPADIHLQRWTCRHALHNLYMATNG